MKNITLVEAFIVLLAIAFLVTCFMSTTFLYTSVSIIAAVTVYRELRSKFFARSAK